MEKSKKKRRKIKIHRLSAVTALIIVCVTAFCSHIYAAEAAKTENLPPRVIAHAGGTARGYNTTNSLEAEIQSIEAGRGGAFVYLDLYAYHIR